MQDGDDRASSSSRLKVGKVDVEGAAKENAKVISLEFQEFNCKHSRIYPFPPFTYAPFAACTPLFLLIRPGLFIILRRC